MKTDTQEAIRKAIEAAFREGYNEGYANGSNDATGFEFGALSKDRREVKREQDTAWRDSEAIKTCPKCGSTDTNKRHADTPNNAGTETDWRQCEECDHQFDHQ